MLVAELQELEEVKSLLAKGQQEGVIAYGEVAKALSEVEVDEGDIEELYGYLEAQGVEMVDDLDPAQAATGMEPADGKRGRNRKQAALDLTVNVLYGRPIHRVTEALRQNVINRVENLTGLEVTEVNITVNDVTFPEQ